MSLSRRTFLQALTSVGAFPGSFTASAAAYPAKPITIVVPFTAGSATDLVARILGERFASRLQQPCVVENRAGAGGTIGAAYVASAHPDGYTLLVHSAGHVANGALYPKLKYNTVDDFVPISMIADVPNVIAVNASSGIKTLGDLVSRGKAKAGSLAYGSAGSGSASHIAAERFRIAAGFESLHVPYKGASPALTDLLGGRFDWIVAPVGLVSPFFKEGRLIPLAVTTRERTPLLKLVPTTLESGFANSDYNFWIGMFAPRNTPDSVAALLGSTIAATLDSPDVRARFADAGADVRSMTQNQFASLVRTQAMEMTGWIRKHGIQAD